MLADPQCPVVAPGAVCPPKPIVATVRFSDIGGSEVQRVTSGKDGTFRVFLPPGQYVASEVVPAGRPPSLKAQTLTVVNSAFTRVVLLFDTGIR